MFCLPLDIFNTCKNYNFITLSNHVSVLNTGQVFQNLWFYRASPETFVLIFTNAFYVKEGAFYCIADEATIISHFGGLVAISRRNIKLLFEERGVCALRACLASLRNGRRIGGGGAAATTLTEA